MKIESEKVIKRNQRRSFSVKSARAAIRVDVVTSYEAAERLAILLESELGELASTSWSTAAPKVKAVKGTPKGGKGGKMERLEMTPKEKVEKMERLEMTPKEKVEKKEKEKKREKSNPVISRQRPKMVATKVNDAQGIAEH